MAIVSFIGAYSISSLAQYILSLYLGQWPLLASVVMNIILVVGLTYFAMPFLSRFCDAGYTQETYEILMFNKSIETYVLNLEYYNCKNDCSKVTLNKIKIYDICLMIRLARERKYGLINRNFHLD